MIGNADVFALMNDGPFLEQSASTFVNFTPKNFVSVVLVVYGFLNSFFA